MTRITQWIYDEIWLMIRTNVLDGGACVCAKTDLLGQIATVDGRIGCAHCGVKHFYI